MIVLEKGDHCGNARKFMEHHAVYRHLQWDFRWGLSLPERAHDGRWTLGLGLVVGEPDDTLLHFMHHAKRIGRKGNLLPFSPTPGDVRRCVWALETIVRNRDVWGVAA